MPGCWLQDSNKKTGHVPRHSIYRSVHKTEVHATTPRALHTPLYTVGCSRVRKCDRAFVHSTHVVLTSDSVAAGAERMADAAPCAPSAIKRGTAQKNLFIFAPSRN